MQEPAPPPQYHKGVWSAFVMPLANGYRRYLDLVKLSFVDVPECTAPPLNGSQISRDMLYRVGELNKLAFVHNSIRSWAEANDIDASKFEYKKTENKKINPKQDPVYPGTESSLLEPILDGSGRYKTRAEAISLIEKLRAQFTTPHLKPDEIREDHDFFWIYNYALTEADRAAELKLGSYARIQVEPLGSLWQVTARPVQDPPWGDPARGLPRTPHPNWSVRTLRELKKGPLFFPTEVAARAELDWLADRYSKVLRLSDNKIACMIYKRQKEGKRIDFDRVQIRLGFDEHDRPYLFMDWRFAEKHKRPAIVSQNREHDPRAVESLTRSMFEPKNEAEVKIAHLAARELLNWEGRGKLKADYQGTPGLIYHYTSEESLNAILAGGSFWLNDLRYMNDMSEIIHGHGVLVSFFSTFTLELAEQGDGPNSRRADILSKIDQLVGKPSRDPIYGLCLTENIGQYSQWKNYGRDGNGVALGLDRDALIAALGPSDLGLRRVHYHPDRKTNILYHIMKSVFEDPFLSQIPVEDLSQSIASVLRSLVPVFKHDSFYTEKEWRLIRKGGNDDSDWIEKTREKTSGDLALSVPYVTLDLKKHLGIEIKDILRLVVVGSSSRKIERSRSVEAKLRSYKLHDVEVEISDVPFSAF